MTRQNPINFVGTNQADNVRETTNAFNDIGILLNFNGAIDTRGGNDTVSGTATGDTSYGIFNNGNISLGAGHDSIRGSGSFTGLQISRQPGILDGGDGNDTITGIANSIGYTHNAYGMVVEGYLTGGSGDDFISGEARGVVRGNVSIGLVVSANVSTGGLAGTGIVEGGNGNDTIMGIGINETGLGIGISVSENGSILGKNGDDIITGYGTSVGIQDGILDGGNGQDRFKARLIDAEGQERQNQGGAIANVTLFGGNGNDLFDVGYGNAKINGERDFDTLILPGSANNYSIQSSDEGLTILRDGYSLTALNIENIIFSADPLHGNYQGS